MSKESLTRVRSLSRSGPRDEGNQPKKDQDRELRWHRHFHLLLSKLLWLQLKEITGRIFSNRDESLKFSNESDFEPDVDHNANTDNDEGRRDCRWSEQAIFLYQLSDDLRAHSYFNPDYSIANQNILSLQGAYVSTSLCDVIPFSTSVFQVIYSFFICMLCCVDARIWTLQQKFEILILFVVVYWNHNEFHFCFIGHLQNAKCMHFASWRNLQGCLIWSWLFFNI